tara:strand:+ start:1727 stop:2263 length:537 start_codon:yes stop_codon:yes gene_type:complete
MSDNPAIANFKHYGISPWEIEVLYELFTKKFEITQEMIEQTDENFVSWLEIILPVQFSEEFFQWFEFKSWEKVKSIIKEMKRRRGSGNAIRVEIYFIGKPSVRFVVDLKENHDFNGAMEKIDYVVELLQYHLGEKDVPKNLTEIIYKFHIDVGRWMLNTVFAEDKKFICAENSWKAIT